MGCEAQYERENQEKPGETKGDTEKWRKIHLLGGKQVFFGWCTPTKTCVKKERKITCDMLQNTGDLKKPYVATPLLTKMWRFLTCIFAKRRTMMFKKNKTSNEENKKTTKRMEKGFGNKNRKPPKCARNDEETSNRIYGWFLFNLTKAKEQKKKRDKHWKTNKDRKPENKQRIDEKIKHCNWIVRGCSFSWKQSKEKTKRMKETRKQKKTTPPKN